MVSIQNILNHLLDKFIVKIICKKSGKNLCFIGLNQNDEFDLSSIDKTYQFVLIAGNDENIIQNDLYYFDKSFCVMNRYYSLFTRKVNDLSKNLTVSVIIPLFNSEKTILRSLKSVESQSYPIKEIVVVNDGSSDNGEKIVQDFINQSKLKTILINQENSGPSRARNIGISASSGDLIAFLDSDDYWSNNKIECQINVIKDLPNFGLIATNRNNEFFESFLIWRFGTVVRLPFYFFFLKNFCPTPTVILKRSIVDKVGLFDEKMKYCEDSDFWRRIAKRYDCYLLNQSLATTGDGKPSFGASGLSSNLYEMQKGEIKSIIKSRSEKEISLIEAIIYCSYSMIKFLRRVVIVSIRKAKK